MFRCQNYPRGETPRGGEARKLPPHHTRAHILQQDIDEICAQAFKETRVGGEDKKAHAWGSLATGGGAGSPDTKKRVGPKPRQYPGPRFKLRRLQGGRGRHVYQIRESRRVESQINLL